MYHHKCIFLFLLIAAIGHEISSQSLIRNGDFEDHIPLPKDFNKVYLPRSTIEFLKDWTRLQFSDIAYCHKDYLQRFGHENYKRAGYLFFWDSLTVHSGKGMVKLQYNENGSVPPADSGFAGYLNAPFIEPLVPGEVYEISMWVYRPYNPVADTAIEGHIGFYLSRRKPIEAPGMIETEYFFADSTGTDQWVEIKKYVRALCNMRYITIGAFSDETFPLTFRFLGDHKLEYYVDDVNVIRVDEDTLPPEIVPTPYCEYYKKQTSYKPPRVTTEMSIYFETNESILDTVDQIRLDSFYSKNSAVKGMAYILSGHTDNEGTDNYNLSSARIQSVENYLRVKHKLSEYKYISFPRGSKDPVGDNKTSAGKQENRRVTIRTSNIPTNAVVYRRGLEHLEKRDIANATRIFKVWLNTAPALRKMELLHDSRLNALKSSPYWKQLVSIVRESYESYVKPDDAFFLDSMYYVDQRYRTYRPDALTGTIAEFDTFNYDDYNADLDDFYAIDSVNIISVRKFINEKGFPKISEVGRRQVRMVCYLIIHTEDTSMMKTYLPLIEERCKEGEAEWDAWAMMFDKYLMEQGLPQLYGMQSIFIDAERTKLKLYKIDDLKAVNDRRKKIGVGPVRDPDEIITLRKMK